MPKRPRRASESRLSRQVKREEHLEYLRQRVLDAPHLEIAEFYESEVARIRSQASKRRRGAK